VIRLQRSRCRLLLLATFVAASLCAGSAAANPSTSAIEGVWTFNGGQIAVQRLANGTYEGIVVSETQFASCTHPVGQHIWTGITEQKDGSFWGLHQWYFADCKENPMMGPTAWRVLEGSGGVHYLRVCFSHPGTSQPTIAANGDPRQESEYAAYHVTYGCANSALIAPLPVVAGKSGPSADGPGGGASPTVERLSLPSARMCLKRGSRFTVRLKDPQYDPFKTVTITYKGHKLATKRSGHEILATVKLSHLHKGASFTIAVHATTVLGHKLSTRRTYHICGGKKRHKHKKG
jgi:hypothetical protein